MKKEASIKDWERMFKDLNDKDKIQENIRKQRLKDYIEDKKKDTGYDID